MSVVLLLGVANLLVVTAVLGSFAQRVVRAGGLLSVDASELARFLKRRPDAVQRLPALLPVEVVGMTRELAEALSLQGERRIAEVNSVLLDIESVLDGLSTVQRTGLKLSIVGALFSALLGFLHAFAFGEVMMVLGGVGLALVSMAFSIGRLAKTVSSVLRREVDAWISACVPEEQLVPTGAKASALKRRRR